MGEVRKSERAKERERERKRERKRRPSSPRRFFFLSRDRRQKSLALAPSGRRRAGLEPPPRQLRTPLQLTIGDPFLAIEHQEPARLRERRSRRLGRSPPIRNSPLVVDARRCRIIISYDSLRFAHPAGDTGLASGDDFKSPSSDASVGSTRSGIAALIAKSFLSKKTARERSEENDRQSCSSFRWNLFFFCERGTFPF